MSGVEGQRVRDREGDSLLSREPNVGLEPKTPDHDLSLRQTLR